MKKYVVMQGALSESGSGNMYVMEEFTDKHTAIKYFNSIKRKTYQWYIKKREYLATSVEKVVTDKEGNEKRTYVDYFECDYNGEKRKY